MLVLELDPLVGWSDEKEEFVQLKPSITLELEHSLLSIKEWEARFHKAFFNDKHEKTDEELLYYIQCMIVRPKEFKMNDIVTRFTHREFEEIRKYLDDQACGKKLPEPKDGKNKGHIKGDLMTAIDIYYFMFELGIPKECERWHINMLMTQIEFTNRKRNPKKKHSTKMDRARARHNLNAQRREALGY